MSYQRSTSKLQGGPKKWGHKLVVIILSNLNRFTILFHWKIPWQICSKLVFFNPTTVCICCHTTLWNINARKQVINDKLQCSVATYLRCGVGNFLNRWLFRIFIISYKQERGCLVHSGRLTSTLVKDEESARDNDVPACNFVKHSPILIFFHSQTQQ